MGLQIQLKQTITFDDMCDYATYLYGIGDYEMLWQHGIEREANGTCKGDTDCKVSIPTNLNGRVFLA